MAKKAEISLRGGKTNTESWYPHIKSKGVFSDLRILRTKIVSCLKLG